MSEIILHHYDASPFTQKALRLLGIKDLAWRSVETPMLPPKPDLVALTGGYRGTPVMQIGADVYVDSQRIAIELERRHPEPTLYPGDAGGLSHALVEWSHAFFRSGLRLAITALSDQWPEAFLADRKTLFHDLDFDQVKADVVHARSQFLAHAAFLERQLADGRAFLEGARPGLADVQAAVIPWFARASVPEVDGLLRGLGHLPAWEARVAALGEGRRVPMTAEEALAVAYAATPAVEPAGIADDDPLALESGAEVEVAPDDSARGGVRGRLARLSPEEIVVVREGEQVGEVAVHFPRLGYRVTCA